MPEESTDAEPEVRRDGMLSATPGRTTITSGATTLHVCAEGRYMPPDRSY